MKGKEADRIRIQHILDAVREIEEYVEKDIPDLKKKLIDVSNGLNK